MMRNNHLRMKVGKAIFFLLCCFQFFSFSSVWGRTYSKAHVFFAVETNNTELLREVLKVFKGKDLFKYYFDSKLNMTPMMVASAFGHVDSLGVLLEHQADHTKINDQNMQAIDYASIKGHCEIIELMFERNIKWQKYSLSLPILFRMKYDHFNIRKTWEPHFEEILKAVIESGVSLASLKIDKKLEDKLYLEHKELWGKILRFVSLYGDLALFWAAHQGELKLVKWLMRLGFNPRRGLKIQGKYESPFTIALKNNHHSVAKYYLDLHFSHGTRPKLLQQGLEYALQNEDMELVKDLFQQVDHRKWEQSYVDDLFYDFTVKRKKLSIQFLIEQHKKPSNVDRVLVEAVNKKYFAIAKIYQDLGVNLSANTYITSLKRAIIGGHLDIIQFYFSIYNFNLRTLNDETLIEENVLFQNINWLTLATYFDQHSIVQFLLSQEANVNKSGKRCTLDDEDYHCSDIDALLVSVQRDRLKLVKLLFTFGHFQVEDKHVMAAQSFSMFRLLAKNYSWIQWLKVYALWVI